VPERRGGFAFAYRPQQGTPSWVVIAVPAGGPGARAGLKDGDRIVSIGGIEQSLDPMPWGELLEQKPGTHVEVVVHRNADRVKIDLTLADFP
jgi:C-terminal processing protease CtpA/Prc